MSDKEKQQATEWGICLVRWGLLACIMLTIVFSPAHRGSLSDLVLVLAVWGAYNLLVTLFLTFHLFFALLPTLSLIVDVLVLLLLLFRSGGVASPFFFFPVLAILQGALRFRPRAGLAAALIFAINAGVHTLLDTSGGQVQPLQGAMQAVLFLLAAGAGAALAQQAGGSGPARGTTPTAPGDDALPDNIRMIYEMASTFSATLNYERVLEAILDISRLGFDDLGMRVGESVGMVLLYDKDGDLYPASARNLSVSGDESRRIKGAAGIVAEATASAAPVIGASPADDPELSVFRSLATCKSMLCVPLRAGFETFGVVLFGSIKPQVYTGEHQELLSIFCNQATVALQNASLYQTLKEERDKIVNKEEEARHKLARDLHDGPTQDVAAIAMRLNFARLLVERDPARAKSELERLEDLAHRTVKEIRSMLFTLRPIILETEGLVAAVNQYAENLKDNEGLQVEVDAGHYQDCLDSEAQGVVFAILEEAINNARKHAHASRVRVRLAVQRDLFIAQVTDNGVGFDVQAVESGYSSRGSLGMVNLKERAQLVGGTLNLESTLGQGTRVTLLIPLSDRLS